MRPEKAPKYYDIIKGIKNKNSKYVFQKCFAKTYGLGQYKTWFTDDTLDFQKFLEDPAYCIQVAALSPQCFRNHPELWLLIRYIICETNSTPKFAASKMPASLFLSARIADIHNQTYNDAVMELTQEEQGVYTGAMTNTYIQLLVETIYVTSRACPPHGDEFKKFRRVPPYQAPNIRAYYFRIKKDIANNIANLINEHKNRRVSKYHYGGPMYDKWYRDDKTKSDTPTVADTIVSSGAMSDDFDDAKYEGGLDMNPDNDSATSSMVDVPLINPVIREDNKRSKVVNAEAALAASDVARYWAPPSEDDVRGLNIEILWRLKEYLLGEGNPHVAYHAEKIFGLTGFRIGSIQQAAQLMLDVIGENESIFPTFTLRNQSLAQLYSAIEAEYEKDKVAKSNFSISGGGVIAPPAISEPEAELSRSSRASSLQSEIDSMATTIVAEGGFSNPDDDSESITSSMMRD